MRFQAKACPGLDPGWKPVRVKKTRQIKKLEPRFDSIETGLQGSSCLPCVQWRVNSRMQRRITMQQRGKLMQLLVAEALRLDRLHGGQHVVAIVSGTTVPLLNVMELLGQ